jgi:hypothetical protein
MISESELDDLFSLLAGWRGGVDRVNYPDVILLVFTTNEDWLKSSSHVMYRSYPNERDIDVELDLASRPPWSRNEPR